MPCDRSSRFRRRQNAADHVWMGHRSRQYQTRLGVAMCDSAPNALGGSSDKSDSFDDGHEPREWAENEQCGQFITGLASCLETGRKEIRSRLAFVNEKVEEGFSAPNMTSTR